MFRFGFKFRKFSKYQFGIALSALMLASCSGIPTSAPIKYGPEINTSDTDQYIQVIGRPPVDGMDQNDIVRGFLGALADSRDSYAVARDYLTDDAAKNWRPDIGITIYDFASLQVTVSAEDATASFAKFGELDSSGYLTISPSSSQITQNFGLTRNANGEWRISKLADGLLLTSNDVDRSFNGYATYFFSPDRKRLVADTVLVPQTVTGSATSLVQSLLDGPSAKMALSVVNSFPAGTKLTYGSVPVLNGVATVDLTNQVLSVDQSTRAQMSAQLVWTLGSLPNVTAIEIKVSGQPLLIAGLKNRQSTRDWALFNPAQFTGTELVHFVRDNQIFSYGLDGTETLVVQSNPTDQLNVGLAKGAVEGGSIAAISSDNKQLLASTGRGGQFSVVAAGQALSKPSWDQSGSIFYSDYGVGIFEINSKRQSRMVEFDSTNFANPAQVKQIAVARDGIRVALVISDGSTDLLLGGALVKTETTTRIIGLHLLERNLTTIQDLAWQTPTSIAVLGSDSSGGNLIFDVDLTTGTSTTTSAPLSAQSIASSLGKQIYVGTVSGAKMMIVRQSGSIWTDVAEGSSPYLAQ